MIKRLALSFSLVVMSSAVAAAGAPGEVDVDAAAGPGPEVAATTTTEAASAWTTRAPYFSAGGVYAFENVTSNTNGDIGNSAGYDLRIGYQVCDWSSVEVEWQSMVKFDRDSFDPITGNEDPNLEARMLSLNGRFIPLQSRIQPYGLLGGGWFNVQADRGVGHNIHESSFAAKFGVGVAGYITDRIGLALEAAYILPLSGKLGGGDRFDLIPITASVFIRFK